MQAEDEIAAIGAAIGASYGGALGVTTTSGPGVALKGESISLAVALELPLVIVDVQRAGPSTGMPTKTEQADLNMALFGRHGEAPVAVDRPAVSGRLFLRRARGLPHRDHLSHPGHCAFRRVRGERLRAVAAARGQRPARPAHRRSPRHPMAMTASSTRTCATRRRSRGLGPRRVSPGWSTASAAWRRPTRPVTSPTTRPTTTSWCAPGRRASKPSRFPTSRSRIRPGRPTCSCWAGVRPTARSARRRVRFASVASTWRRPTCVT